MRNFNQYYVAYPQYEIDPRYIKQPIKLGDGVNMSDPLNPMIAPYKAFEKLPIEREKGSEEFENGKWSDSSVATSFSFKECDSLEEEMKTIRQYFKASYSLTSLNQSLSKTKTEREKNHIVYALLEKKGESERFNASDFRWNRDPASEKIDDLDLARENFLIRYGSHYVHSITYGIRIGLQVMVKKKAVTDSQKISADLEIALGCFATKGEFRLGQENKSEKYESNIKIEITSGGREDGGITTATTIEQIVELLKDLHKVNIKYKIAPIEATLMHYRPTLHSDWRNTYSALYPKDVDYNTPIAQYGVPRGTIIAWHPTSEYLEGLEGEEGIKIVPPEGWAICDGTMETPDLCDRFICGTSEWNMLYKKGGNVEHNHDGFVEEMDRKKHKSWYRNVQPIKHKPVAATHPSHQHNIKSSDNLPPYINLIFIMKL